MSKKSGIWVTLRDGRRIMINKKSNKARSGASSKLSSSNIQSVKSGKEYKKKFREAKSNMAKENPKSSWRVTDDHSEKEYDGMKLFSSKGGSVFAVKKDGDIVSVCKNPTDTVRGKDLLEEAIRQGGKKLDTYEGNYGFYRKCGFEPVSWVKFDEKYAPSDWKKGRDDKEDILFFKYTGNKSKNYESLEDFKKRVPCAKDYGEAEEQRNREVKNGNKKI